MKDFKLSEKQALICDSQDAAKNTDFNIQQGNIFIILPF